MKIGDKTLCTKDAITKFNNRIYYKKGKWYKLEQGRDNNEFLIESELDFDNWYWNIRKGENNYIGKYFLTENEIRKMKLNVIKCNI